MKSESRSKSQNPKYYRKRALARGCGFRAATQDDLKYIWADYKKQGYDNSFPSLNEEGFEPDEFSELFNAELQAGGFDVVMFTEGKSGDGKPLGYLLLWNRGRLIILYQFRWFFWASDRNRLECAMHYLNEIRSQPWEFGHNYRAVGIVDRQSRSFFRHLQKYKVVREVGVMKNYFMTDTGARSGYLYETCG